MRTTDAGNGADMEPEYDAEHEWMLSARCTRSTTASTTGSGAVRRSASAVASSAVGAASHRRADTLIPPRSGLDGAGRHRSRAGTGARSNSYVSVIVDVASAPVKPRKPVPIALQPPTSAAELVSSAMFTLSVPPA